MPYEIIDVNTNNGNICYFSNMCFLDLNALPSINYHATMKEYPIENFNWAKVDSNFKKGNSEGKFF